jgi:ParB/RepB/Spo0J family partition protein
MPRKKKEALAEASAPAPVEESNPLDQVLSLVNIELDRIEITGWNPRKFFDEEELKGLAASIKSEGLHQAIKVRHRPDPESNGQFQLIAGERRIRAFRLLGYSTIPAIVEDMDDAKMKRVMAIENLQRADLQPLEIAEGLQELLKDGTTQDELARSLGKTQGWISNYLRLLKAPEDLQQMLISQKITPKHAQVILPYAEYAVYKKLMVDLKNDQERGPISVSALQEHVQYALTHDYRAENVLDLTQMPHEYRRFKELFDRSGCDGCESNIKLTVDGSNEPHKYCLAPGCYKKRLHEAAIKLDAEKQKIIESGAEAPKLKASVMDLFEYGEYASLSYTPFDKATAGCLKCAKRKVTSKKEEICLDPKCYKNKQTQSTKAKNKQTKGMKQQALEAIEAYGRSRSGPLNTKELRVILDHLVRNEQSGIVKKKSLEHWTNETWAYRIQTITCKVPDDGLVMAILNMCLFGDVEGANDQNGYGLIKRRVEDLPKDGDSRAYVSDIFGIKDDSDDDGKADEELKEDMERALGIAGKVKGYSCPCEDEGIIYGTLPAAREASGCDECPEGMNAQCDGPAKIFVTANEAKKYVCPDGDDPDGEGCKEFLGTLEEAKVAIGCKQCGKCAEPRPECDGPEEVMG